MKGLLFRSSVAFFYSNRLLASASLLLYPRQSTVNPEAQDCKRPSHSRKSLSANSGVNGAGKIGFAAMPAIRASLLFCQSLD